MTHSEKLRIVIDYFESKNIEAIERPEIDEVVKVSDLRQIADELEATSIYI